VPGGLQLPDEGGSLVLGSTSLPTTGCRQPEGPGCLHNRPTHVSEKGFSVERRSRGEHSTSPNSWEPARGEGAPDRRGSNPGTTRVGG
jgi:hypothetical protein